MSTFNRFDCFSLDLMKGVHDLSTDQLGVALTNSAPSSSTHDNISDITEISYTNLSSRNVTTTSCTQTGGIATLVTVDLTLTASGAVGPFRYPILYNTTNGALIGWLDQTGEISMISGDTYVVNFGANAVRVGA